MSQPPPFVSVVIPVYRAEKILPVLCQRLDAALSSIADDYEMILVDDRSPDGSWPVLESLTRRYSKLVAVRLSRNFGQPYATTAGLDMARGEWTVVMDCDLQDRPEDIAKLLQKANDGYDVVLARRIEKKHTILQRMGSYVFWKLFGLLSGYRVDSSIGSFRVMHRSVVDAYCQCRESARIFGGLVHWLGFSVAEVEVQHAPRYEGKSTYDLRKLLKMAFDGIISFSNRPLVFSIALGAFISFAAGAYGLYWLIRYLAFGGPLLPGWLSTVTMISFLGGLILINQGLLGVYIGRIYNESKKRPIYVVAGVVRGERSTARRIQRQDATRELSHVGHMDE
jgi:dolichol-phosphate mannosyltransferase